MVFMGTAELACESLRRLAADEGLEVLAVVTQPDRPKGRDLKLQPPPVKRVALELGLRVLQPPKARSPDLLEELIGLEPHLIVVAAYGQLLPKAILDLPRHGCLNVHTSLLPKYRGAAPIQWAILNGDQETGVTLMRMDEGLDTGPMVAIAKTPILEDDNSQTLHDRLAILGAELLVKKLPGYVRGDLELAPQPAEGVSYARKITKDDGKIDWRLSAREIFNQARAFTPWPGVYTSLPEASSGILKVRGVRVLEGGGGQCGQILRLSREGMVVVCGAGALRIRELQMAGGRWMTVSDFLAGHRLAEGACLGGEAADPGSL